jgi:hypothetical protein
VNSCYQPPDHNSDGKKTRPSDFLSSERSGREILEAKNMGLQPELMVHGFIINHFMADTVEE